MKKLLPLIIGFVVLCKTAAFGNVLVFWDANGAVDGSGGPTPTGTWGVDAYWNEDATGGGAVADNPRAWANGDFAVFAAGNDATGAYTVNVSGLVDVGDIHVDMGTVTFEPANPTDDSLKLGILLSVGHKDASAVARYNVPINSVSAGVVRYKQGTVIFGAVNTFNGPFTIEGGVVQCAVPNALAAANPLVLANNDPARTDFFEFWRFTPAVFNSGGLDQQLGTLTLAGGDPTIVRALDLGNGAGTLRFEDSSAVDWTGYTLTIQNYALGSSKLRFGTSNTGLTATQLSQIRFADFAGALALIDSNGFVTPYILTISSITPVGASFKLDWAAINARTYRVWSKDTITAASWDFLADVIASGDTASYTDPTPSPTGRFYRLELLP